QSFLDEHLAGGPFPWTKMDAVVLPPFDRYRKPHPYPFLRGLATACPGRALYIGELDTEVQAARAQGFAGYQKTTTDTPFPTVADVSTALDAQYTFTPPP